MSAERRPSSLTENYNKYNIIMSAVNSYFEMCHYDNLVGKMRDYGNLAGKVGLNDLQSEVRDTMEADSSWFDLFRAERINQVIWLLHAADSLRLDLQPDGDLSIDVEIEECKAWRWPGGRKSGAGRLAMCLRKAQEGSLPSGAADRGSASDIEDSESAAC